MTAGRLPLIALLALAVALTQARAAPLDAESCAKLQTEQAQLEDAGVGKDMAKGAAWARDNLGLVQLQQVRRFIEIEEQLVFRCRNKSIVHWPPEKEAAANIKRADQDNDDGKAQPAARPAASPRRQDSRAAKKARARAAARGSTEPGVTSIMKRPPKAKIDDAHKVPPPDPSIDPFATQLKPAD